MTNLDQPQQDPTPSCEQAAQVYIPADWRQALVKGVTLPEHTHGAALFADISGFTPLTEALARALGLRRGAEELSNQLDLVYDALIAEVDRYAGSVLGFAGDAITCWFSEDPASLPGLAEAPQPPGPAAPRAAACALAIQQTMRQFAAIAVPGQAPVTLSIKVAIASGPARRFVVGDPAIHQALVLAGDTLTRMAATEHLSKPGEILVDAATLEQLGPTAEIQEWRDQEGVRAAVLRGFSEHVPPTPWPSLAPNALTAAQIRPWVLPAVYARMQADLGDFLTEFRPTIALFLRFAGIDYEQDPAAGAKLDAYIRWVQQCLTRYDGTLLQITIGDKGSYLYINFGAPTVHEDEARRAVSAALELRPPAEGSPAAATFSGLRQVQIGLSRGIMRAGSYGGSTRRTYAALGDQVNLAARLMMYARPGEVIVNQTVQKMIAQEFTWELLEPIQVKGKSAPVVIARLLGRNENQLPSAAFTGALVGRQAEIGQLQAGLEAVVGGQNRLLLLEGPTGIGKSRLVAELIRTAHTVGLTVLEGTGQSIEQHTPYRAWRDIFAAYFDLSHTAAATAEPSLPTDPSQALGSLVQAFAPTHLPHLPLLNDLLSGEKAFTPLPETAHTAALDPAQRQQSLLAMLADLLFGLAGRAPLVVILEDAQWLDSLSWTLLERLAKGPATATDARLMLVVVIRPLDEDPHLQEQIAQLQALPGAGTILLAPLSAAESVAVAAGRLGLPSQALPAVLADLVAERVEGNPFFAEQLVLNLQEQGLLRLNAVDGAAPCEICADPAELHQALPDTIQGMVLARMDRLPLERQLVIKVASVLGNIFAYNPLSHTIKQNTPISEAALTSHLGALDARELVALQVPEPDLTYVFKHLTVQEIAYQSMGYAQRRQLHRAIARWYESVYTADLSPIYALLAHHWSGAEEPAKAIHYLLLAGDETRRLYALPEAIAYYQRALSFLRQGEDYETTGRTLMKLGLTYHLAFNYRAARQAYEEGFSLWQQAAAQSTAAALPPAHRPLRTDCPYLPLTLDPALAGDIDTVSVIDQLYSGLVDLEAGLDIIPDVAQSWEILDEGLKYIFHLRPDVKWSDGQPLTAADFETAWRRLLDPALGSPIARSLYDVKGARAFHQRIVTDPASIAVHALDDHTLVVELEQPTSYFLYLMAFCASYPVPRHVIAQHGADWATLAHLATNGPFIPTAWEQHSDQDGILSLVRNPAYHRRFGGNLQQVELRAIPTPEQRLSAYAAGTLDMLSFRNFTGARDRIRQQHAGEYMSVPFLAANYLVFDASRPPFDDPRVRRAFVQAADREEHADVTLEGFTFPATGGFLPPGMPGHSADLGWPFDPDQARRLLAEAGYDANHPLPPIEFLAGPDQQSILTFLAQQWQAHLGVTVSGQMLNWEAFIQRLESSPPHIALNIWVNDYPDPDNFLRASEALRWSRWQDPHYQELVETARRIPDQAQRLELYRQADRCLVETGIITPFNYLRTHLLVKPWIKKFPTSAIKWWYWKDVILEAESGGNA